MVRIHETLNQKFYPGRDCKVGVYTGQGGLTFSSASQLMNTAWGMEGGRWDYRSIKLMYFSSLIASFKNAVPDAVKEAGLRPQTFRETTSSSATE